MDMAYKVRIIVCFSIIIILSWASHQHYVFVSYLESNPKVWDYIIRRDWILQKLFVKRKKHWNQQQHSSFSAKPWVSKAYYSIWAAVFSFSARLNCVLVMLDRYNISNWSCNSTKTHPLVTYIFLLAYHSFSDLFFTWRLSFTRLSKTCAGNLGSEATASAMNRPMLLSGGVWPSWEISKKLCIKRSSIVDNRLCSSFKSV